MSRVVPFLAYWYFHLPNFVLAALMYTLLGRAMLGLFVEPDSPNYIWRFFCRLTDPVVAAVAVVTPKAAAPVVVWLFGFVWLFWLRVALLYLFLLMGAVPQGAEHAMERNFYFIGIAFFGMINGLFNQVWLLFALDPCAGAGAVAAVRQRVADPDVLLADGLDRDHHSRRHPGRDLRALSSGPRTIRPTVSLWIWLAATGLLTLPAMENFLRVGL